MKKLLTILLFFISLGTFAQSNNNNARIFNVKLFGAKGNGVANDGPSIQAAVNAANANNGGKVWFPVGVYIDTDPILSDCNCQIEIPQTLYTTARSEIVFEGESISPEPSGGGLSVGATVPPPTAGAIIYSRLATFTLAGQAIIGTKLTGGFNAMGFQVKNLGLEARNNPSGHGPVVGGIGWKNGGNFSFDHLQYFTDTAGWVSTAPAYDISGIETPDDGSGENYHIKDCMVQGIRTGYYFGEHVVFDNSNAIVCYFGFRTKFGNHSATALRVGTYWCKYDLYASGGLVLANFNMDTEWQNQTKWYDDVTSVKDSANLLQGQIYYTTIQAGVGLNNAKFTVSGGTNVHTLPHTSGVLSGNMTSLMAIGGTVASGTGNSVLYLGAPNVLAQDNSNFYYDYTNHRLGIGTTSPQGGIEIKNATPFFVVNTSTSTGQGGIFFQKSGVSKWSILHDFSSSGTADFAIYDVASSKARFYSDGSGNTNIGGTATAAATAAIAIDNSNNVTIKNGNLAAPNVIGGAAVGGTLQLTPTTNGTKGKILLGSGSAYDDVNSALVIGNTSLSNSVYGIELYKPNPYLLLNSSTSRQASLFYAQNGTVKYQFGMDFANNGTADFYIYDQARSAVRLYINASNGTLSLGGTAQTSTAAGINITSGQVVQIPNLTVSKVVFTDASKNLTSTGIGTSSQLIAGDGSLVTGSVTQATADLTAQTTSGNVTTFTVGTSTATFNISGYINITAVTVDVIEMQVAYTDENNTSQTANFFTQGATSALLSAIGNSVYPPMTIRAKNATTITVKTTLTTGTGSITFDAGGRITQL